MAINFKHKGWRKHKGWLAALAVCALAAAAGVWFPPARQLLQAGANSPTFHGGLRGWIVALELPWEQQQVIDVIRYLETHDPQAGWQALARELTDPQVLSPDVLRQMQERWGKDWLVELQTTTKLAEELDEDAILARRREQQAQAPPDSPAFQQIQKATREAVQLAADRQLPKAWQPFAEFVRKHVYHWRQELYASLRLDNVLFIPLYGLLLLGFGALLVLHKFRHAEWLGGLVMLCALGAMGHDYRENYYLQELAHRHDMVTVDGITTLAVPRDLLEQGCAKLAGSQPHLSVILPQKAEQQLTQLWRASVKKWLLAFTALGLLSVLFFLHAQGPAAGRGWYLSGVGVLLCWLLGLIGVGRYLAPQPDYAQLHWGFLLGMAALLLALGCLFSYGRRRFAEDRGMQGDGARALPRWGAVLAGTVLVGSAVLGLWEQYGPTRTADGLWQNQPWGFVLSLAGWFVLVVAFVQLTGLHLTAGAVETLADDLQKRVRRPLGGGGWLLQRLAERNERGWRSLADDPSKWVQRHRAAAGWLLLLLYLALVLAAAWWWWRTRGLSAVFVEGLTTALWLALLGWGGLFYCANWAWLKAFLEAEPDGAAPEPPALPLPFFQVLLGEYAEQQRLHRGLPDIQLNRERLAKYERLKAQFAAHPGAAELQACIQTEVRQLDAELVREFYAALHRQPGAQRAALCFSGGGVRSATFVLGVLQGLLKQGLSLANFHYLSTVSGGGYTGSWLTAWLHRAGLGPVEQALKAAPPLDPLAPEPAPLQHLRRYSNPLTPQLGLVSADTWTLVGIYLRNLSLNWLVLLPLLMVFLALPRLTMAFAVWGAPDVNVLCLLPALSVLLGTLGMGYVVTSRPSLRKMGGARARFHLRRDEVGFLLYGLLPVLLAGGLAVSFWAWYPIYRNANEPPKQEALKPVAPPPPALDAAECPLPVPSPTPSLLEVAPARKLKLPNGVLLLYGLGGLALLGLMLAWRDWQRARGRWLSLTGLALALGVLAWQLPALEQPLWQDEWKLSTQSPWPYLLYVLLFYGGGMLWAWLLAGRFDRRELWLALGPTALIGGLALWGATQFDPVPVHVNVARQTILPGPTPTPALTPANQPVQATLQTDPATQTSLLKLEAPLSAPPPVLKQDATAPTLANVIERLRHTALYIVFAVPVFLLAFLAAATIFIGMSSGILTDADREWMARAGAWTLMAGLGWMLLSAVVLFAPPLVMQGYERSLALLTTSSGLITLIFGWLPKTAATLRGEKDKQGKSAGLLKLVLPLVAVVFALCLCALLSLATSAGLRWLAQSDVVFFCYRHFLPDREAPLTHVAAVLDAAQGTDWHWLVLHELPGAVVLGGVLILLGLGGVLGVFVNANKFSLHAANRDRLVRAYLGASHALRQPNPFTGFDGHDNLQLHELLTPVFTPESFKDFPYLTWWLWASPQMEAAATAPGESETAARARHLTRYLWQEFTPTTQQRLRELWAADALALLHAAYQLRGPLREALQAEGPGLPELEFGFAAETLDKDLRQLRDQPALVDLLIDKLCATHGADFSAQFRQALADYWQATDHPHEALPDVWQRANQQAEAAGLRRQLADEFNRLIHGELLVPLPRRQEHWVQQWMAKLFYLPPPAESFFPETLLKLLAAEVKTQARGAARPLPQKLKVECNVEHDEAEFAATLKQIVADFKRQPLVPVLPFRWLPRKFALLRQTPVERMRINRRLLELALPDVFHPFAEHVAEARPFPVLNMALNLVHGQELAWQERKAESFFASPLHVGAQSTGYRDVREYAIGFAGQGALTLGTSMAISGAAANPNAGYNSSPLITFFLSLFNVRMGWWLGNPGVAGALTYRTSSPFFAPNMLVAELLGFTDAEHPYVNLSDGGHFDNLGIYEMVRRRCQFIVVTDGGQDDNYAFDDLGLAIRRIRADLGVPIVFERQPKLPIGPRAGDDGKTPHADKNKYCALGRIRYSAVDGAGVPDGTLILIKPAVYGDEPADIYNYAQSNPRFPQDPTFTDQFFSESQFESYRHLGEYVVQTICNRQPITGLAELEEEVSDYLGPQKAAPPDYPMD